jgi:hypothetical protein
MTAFANIEGAEAILENQKTLYITERGWQTTSEFGVDDGLWRREISDTAGRTRTLVATLDAAVQIERGMELFFLEHANDPRFHGPDHDGQQE